MKSCEMESSQTFKERTPLLQCFTSVHFTLTWDAFVVKPFKYRGIPVQLKELLTKTERIVKYAEGMDIIIVVLTVYFGIRALHSSNNRDSPGKVFCITGFSTFTALQFQD